MNFRQWLRRFCTLGCGLLLVFSTLLVIAPAWAAIPIEIKNSPDADKHRTEIAAAVTQEISDLQGEDAVKRTRAREAMIVEVNAPGTQPYSGVFLDIYCQELDKQLMPLTDNSVDVRVRLNVAIIVARVGDRVESARLYDVTEKLLHDKSEAVVHWALKAARAILPAVLQGAAPNNLQPNQQKLLAAIEAQADNPLLLSEVYDALALRFEDAKPGMPNRDKMLMIVVPRVVNLLQARVKLYQVQTPPEPAAVVTAVLFLSNPTTWNALSKEPKLQLEIVQTLTDLIGLAAQRAVLPNSPRSELEGVIVKAAQGLGAIAYSMNNQKVFSALQPLIKLAPNNPNLLALANKVPAILQQNPAWAGVKPAPGPGATTGPSTAPSAGTAAAK